MHKPSHPRTSLRRLSELRSLALGAALGAILADPMATIHGWARTTRPARLLALAGNTLLALLVLIGTGPDSPLLAHPVGCWISAHLAPLKASPAPPGVEACGFYRIRFRSFGLFFDWTA